MNKKLSTLVLCAFAFGMGFGMNNVVFGDGDGAKTKIGYVNVTKLLEASKTLKDAQSAQAKSTSDMLKWYDTASADIQKQQTKEGKQALIKKYEAQLTQKKNAIKDAYAKKVTQVDNQLNTVITQKSKELGYDIVLRKDSLLYGGVDITSQIVPLVK